MRKLSLYVIFTIFLLSFFSCATNINVRVNRPAKIDLSYAKTIAVIPFSEDPDFWDYIVFGTDTYELGKYFTNKLQTKLLENQYFKVVDHSQVQNSLNYGKVPPCDIYISGKIYNLYTKVKERETVEKDDKTDTETINVDYCRVLNFSLTYNIIDSKTGEILKKFDDSFSIESDYELSKSQVLTATQLAKTDLDNVIYTLITEITPHTVNKNITLLKDKSKNPQMKYADDLVKDGNLTFAYKEYMEIFEKTNMFEAGYNAACILEAQGKYEEAETLLLDLYNLSGNSKALELLKDVRYEILQRNKLIQQDKTRGLK